MSFEGLFGKLCVAILMLNCGFTEPAFAGWQLSGESTIPSNRETTITLKYDGADKSAAENAGSLWIANDAAQEVLAPEFVTYDDNRALISMFIRGERPVKFQVYDTERKTTDAVSLNAKSQRGAGSAASWIPHLTLKGEDNKPVVLVNKQTTMVLTLAGGDGSMPGSTHIALRDHRGRVVFSRFYNTFQLVAGIETLQAPAPGRYLLDLKLLEEPVTSMPRALLRDPQPIPFGKTALEAIDEPSKSLDGVSTMTVVGTRVALEDVPSTATVVGRDRLILSAFGRHSHRIQKNNWPFAIAADSLFEMSARQVETYGQHLLRWQRRLGSSFTPVTLEWGTVQKSAGSYYWPRVDSALAEYRRIMVRPLITLTGRTGWSDQLPTASPANLDAWKNFTGMLSDKHRERIWGLECWEYPKETWKDVADYNKLLSATLTGFQKPDGKRIPAPPVIAGATHGFDHDFFRAIITSETLRRLNGISFDLFPNNKKASPEANGFDHILADARSFLDKEATSSIRLYIRGTGWPVGPDGVTAALQANYMARTHVMAMANDAYKVVWNSLNDKTSLPWAADASARMGLLDENFIPNLSGVSYNLMTYLMSGATKAGVTVQGKARIYKFNLPLQNNKWPGTIYVAWTESPDQIQNVQLKMTHGGGVYALDYLGAEVNSRKVSQDSVNSIEGSYQIPVGFEPVFIWDAGKPR